MSSEVTASVVIPTYNRRDHLRTCLTHLAAQTRHPVEVVVVDASPEDGTRTLVADEFPWVTYLRNDRGAGSTATSRAIGVRASTGEVLAFLDDDAYAEPDWLEELLAPYADASVGGVGGRALNGRPARRRRDAARSGCSSRTARSRGTSRPTRAGSSRSTTCSGRTCPSAGAPSRASGICDTYPGTCLREETDLALRLKRAGVGRSTPRRPSSGTSRGHTPRVAGSTCATSTTGSETTSSCSPPPGATPSSAGTCRGPSGRHGAR